MATAERARPTNLELSRKSASGFKFVHWCCDYECYQLKKKLHPDDANQTSLGKFCTALAAAEAYALYRDFGIYPVSDFTAPEKHRAPNKRQRCVAQGPEQAQGPTASWASRALKFRLVHAQVPWFGCRPAVQVLIQGRHV